EIADAPQTHAFTGSGPRVTLLYLLDRVHDFGAFREYADVQGIEIGMINSHTFRDDVYKFVYITHGDKTVRRRAIDHHLECLDVMRATGSHELKIWLADGTNCAGQDSLRARQDRLAESLQEIYRGLGDVERLVLEYKFFEPAFYHTDVPDWGTSLLH